MSISIAIVDDHHIFRSGIVHLINQYKDFSIIFESASSVHFLKKAPLDQIDILILDISLPDISGLNLLNELKSLSFSGKVIMLSMHEEHDYGIQSMQMGAYSYLNKNIAAEELIECLNTVMQGRLYISKDLSKIMSHNYQGAIPKPAHLKLTKRELEVLKLLAKGLRVSDIAKELGISIKTISTYKARVYERLEIENHSELVLYCMKYGLINQPVPTLKP